MADEKKPIRVWIELEKPATDEEAKKRCELANNMLVRLNDGKPPGVKFMWNERRKKYDIQWGMSSYTLTDNGEWFDLEHLGRPLN